MSIPKADVQMAAALRLHTYHRSRSSFNRNEITSNPALAIRQQSLYNKKGLSQQVLSSLEKHLHLTLLLRNLRCSGNPKPHKYASQEVNETAFQVCF